MSELKLGREYIARTEEALFEIEGKSCGWRAQVVRFRVLNKPSHVHVLDEIGSQRVPLPAHLRLPTWYWVKNLDTDEEHWLSTEFRQISPLPLGEPLVQ